LVSNLERQKWDSPKAIEFLTIKYDKNVNRILTGNDHATTTELYRELVRTLNQDNFWTALAGTQYHFAIDIQRFMALKEGLVRNVRSAALKTLHRVTEFEPYRSSVAAKIKEIRSGPAWQPYLWGPLWEIYYNTKPSIHQFASYKLNVFLDEQIDLGFDDYLFVYRFPF
jgi:hypothetical protein